MGAPTLVVTGYVPLAGHPRTAQEYGALGETLFGALRGNVLIHPFYETLPECWLWRHMQTVKTPATHSVADNPKKNTLAYHCVIHQKVAWLLKAAIRHPECETLVWIDYGIGHVPGITPAVVNDFLDVVRPDDFSMPGCWRKENMILNDLFPCWRFCGGLIVAPRKWVYPLYKAVKRNVVQHIKDTGNVSWEMNTYARIEHQLPIRWYEADHNETMFTNYLKGLSP